MRALKDGDFLVRCSAAQALGNIGDKRATEMLINRLRNKDSSINVRRCVSHALAKIGDKKAIPLLRELLKGDEHKTVQVFAAYGLAKIIKDPDALRFLCESLKDKELEVRYFAAELLGRTDDKKAVEPLINALVDAKAAVRGTAAQALGRIGDKNAIRPLTRVWKSDEDTWTQLCSACALFKITGDENILDFLIEILKSDDMQRRAHAAQVLGAICNKRAVRPLINLLSDSSVLVRQSARRALKVTTKQDFCMDYNEWKQWYEKNKEK